MMTSRGARLMLTLLGIALMLGAGAGVLFIGARNNPPPTRVLIATRDLQPGDTLGIDDLAIENLVMNPKLAEVYVTEPEAGMFLGAYVVDVIRRGDPLNKVKLTSTAPEIEKRAIETRYGLVLTDTKQVVMVLPATPDIMPAQLKSGDVVNILFVAGADSAALTLPEKREPPALAAATPFELPAGVVVPTAEPTAAPVPMMLPLADVLLERIEVLDIHYQAAQSSYTADDNTGPSREINSIVVRVPRNYQTLLSFASATGKIRYAVASPMNDPASQAPAAGVDWGSVVELYQWKREQALARGETLTQTLYPGYIAVQNTPRTGTTP
jgi:Flp pilus assembly protein CpaB